MRRNLLNNRLHPEGPVLFFDDSKTYREEPALYFKDSSRPELPALPVVPGVAAARLDERGLGVNLRDHNDQGIWIQGEDAIYSVQHSLHFDQVEDFLMGWEVTFPEPGYEFPPPPPPEPLTMAESPDPAILPPGTRIQTEDGFRFTKMANGLWTDGEIDLPANLGGQTTLGFRVIDPPVFNWQSELSAREMAVNNSKHSSVPGLLDSLSQSRIAEIRRNVAQNPASPDSALNRLEEDSFKHIRQSVAKNPQTPDWILGKLALEEDPDIRWDVAHHPNASLRTLEQLLRDPDYYVRKAASIHPRLPNPAPVLTDHTKLNDYANNLKATLPGWDVSYGYIGNMHAGGGFDDRSWSLSLRPGGAGVPWQHQDCFHMGLGHRVALDTVAFEAWLEKRIEAHGGRVQPPVRS